MILTAVNKSSQCHDRPFPQITPMTTGDTQQFSTSKTQSSSISKESNECINKGYACVVKWSEVKLPSVKLKNTIKSFVCTTQCMATEMTGTHRVQMC